MEKQHQQRLGGCATPGGGAAGGGEPTCRPSRPDLPGGLCSLRAVANTDRQRGWHLARRAGDGRCVPPPERLRSLGRCSSLGFDGTNSTEPNGQTQVWTLPPTHPHRLCSRWAARTPPLLTSIIIWTSLFAVLVSDFNLRLVHLQTGRCLQHLISGPLISVRTFFPPIRYCTSFLSPQPRLLSS